MFGDPTNLTRVDFATDDCTICTQFLRSCATLERSPSMNFQIPGQDARQERPLGSCQFIFTVVGATGLCGTTAWSQDQRGCYVTVAINGKKIHKTAVLGNIEELEWNDTFSFVAKCNDNLIISAHANTRGRDLLLGQIEESLANVDCTGKGLSRQVPRRQASGSFTLNFRFERRLFGLFIGIDEYKSQAIPKLCGCKRDAQSFMDVLLHKFHVPTDNFLFFANKRATRSAIIIDGFQNHLIKNGNIQRGDAIVIFYAGHGSQTDSPNGWVADGSRVETICPHDERSIGKDGKEIFGIPDRTIGGLLRSLATAKGDNITVIFDTCHSGDISRGMMARTVPNTSSLPEDLDRDIWMRGLPSPKTAVGFLDQTMWSHVLLAACRKDEQALEGTSTENVVRGIFTRAMVKLLYRETDISQLRYSSLLNLLPPLGQRQHPQCSGKNKDRALFGGVVSHPMTYGLSKQGNQYRVEAGEIHGVVKGALFAVHTLPNATAINSEFGILEADLVSTYSCILHRRQWRLSATQFEIPPGARVLVINWQLRERVLRVIMEPPHGEVRPIEGIFSLVDDPECADLMIRRTGGKLLQFKRLDPLMSKYAQLLSGISSEPSLSDILQGVSHFNFHLFRYNSARPLQPYVKVTLRRLTQSNPDQILEEPIYTPDGLVNIPLVLDHSNEVVASSEATADVDCLFYGLTVKNQFPCGLFPYLFYFDASDYSIQPLYHPPCPTMEAPLASARAITRPSELKVGYGEANVEAIKFSLADGKSEDVGFVKLFVSSTYVDMTSLKKDPLLSGAHTRGGVTMIKPPRTEIWDAWTYVIKMVAS
ncbi:hypothetical protein PILCRDRAFT_13260 [Piloderma croceum F 1598]|uniref:Uncharacterized protein n=1 Tax=Piloderma croceum (strain F 1598) TaxID=765440 RepID=A0A0C3BEZ4_PILCF|nr:hypothetical protein PILCRDRAFT_13260 [Piloderma croceum F 1598]